MLNTHHGMAPGWLASFIIAAFSSVLWPQLPHPFILAALILLTIICHRSRLAPSIIGFTIGIVWMASVGHWQRHWQLPHDEIIKITEVEGHVESVVTDHNNPKFLFVVTHTNTRALKFKIRIRLSWQAPTLSLYQGAKLRAVVKVKPAHGLANQGGFLYEQWLASQNILATGYVRSATLLANGTGVTSRQKGLDDLYRMPLQNVAWLAALSFGDRSKFSSEQWQLIQKSGLAHLVAISGLHLAMVAWFAYGLCHVLYYLLGRFFTLSQSINLQPVSMSLVLLSTGFYAYLAGASLPTVRAWLALFIAACLLMLRINISPFRFLLLMLALFIVLQPLSLLTSSFWLSFGAIVVIMMLLWHQPKIANPEYTNQILWSHIKNAAWTMCKFQFALSLLMLPLTAVHFSFVSVLSPFVNLLAVPFVTLILLPLCLLATTLIFIDASLALPVFHLADFLLDQSLAGLHNFTHYVPDAISLPNVHILAWILASLWCLFFGLSLSRKSLIYSSTLLLPLLSHLLPMKQHHWRLHVLDVGQGLAIVLQKAQRAIIYDVGNQFPSGFNMADAVILPFLAYHGIDEVDHLIVSHFDNDHAGALQKMLLGGKVHRFHSNQDVCRQGWRLTWQGIDINALWPPQNFVGEGNDASCVLSISDGKHSVLLTGDISTIVEQQMVKTAPEKLAADVLIVPHHGSNTSSSHAFISAVLPAYAVYSQGYRNRWDFPTQKVVNRYVQGGIEQFATSDSGQITFEFDSQEEQIRVLRYRQEIHARWYLNK